MGVIRQMNRNFEILLNELQVERLERVAQGIAALGYEEQIPLADTLTAVLIAGFECLEQRLGLPEGSFNEL